MSHKYRNELSKSTLKHEARIEQNDREDQYYIDEQLRPMQRIEGGGGPKKVYLQNMPKPVRYFGYFFVIGVPILMLALMIISFFK